ncbi:SRPBCC family protein [Mucilaginibacter calamicampi]|uniref:SRPBCC family protein n=1 Tax=Mucilaginibacter calamicampi TaxID=1302352 RepID=A0ABW2YZU2_9SPHI
MSTFKSTVTVNRSVDEVFNFLADFNNHKGLMPDNVVNWKSGYNDAYFEVPGMLKLSLKITERKPNNYIEISPVEKPPFAVKLNWEIKGDNDTSTVTFIITAELNMMMKMMASAPLQKLADHQTKALVTQLN